MSIALLSLLSEGFYMNTKKLLCAALVLGLSNQMIMCEGETTAPNLISRITSSCVNKTSATIAFLGAPMVWGISKVKTLEGNSKLAVEIAGTIAVIYVASQVIKKTLEQFSDEELDLEDRV